MSLCLGTLKIVIYGEKYASLTRPHIVAPLLGVWTLTTFGTCAAARLPSARALVHATRGSVASDGPAR